jgi:DNA-binding transcriptional ArsR family regulator
MTAPAAPPVPVEPVEEARRAELLLHPLRQRILSEAREASTAAEIARRVGLPPQKVNYHVRTLAAAGFLHPAGEACCSRRSSGR